MKVMKGQGLLYIFNILKEKGRVKKEEAINALEITDLSFWRYIQEITGSFRSIFHTTT